LQVERLVGKGGKRIDWYIPEQKMVFNKNYKEWDEAWIA
jgi:hypothetical protein